LFVYLFAVFTTAVALLLKIMFKLFSVDRLIGLLSCLIVALHGFLHNLFVWPIDIPSSELVLRCAALRQFMLDQTQNKIRGPLPTNFSDKVFLNSHNVPTVIDITIAVIDNSYCIIFRKNTIIKL